jgi:hypothetical protein
MKRTISVKDRVPADPSDASPEQMAAFMRYLLELYVEAASYYEKAQDKRRALCLKTP